MSGEIVNLMLTLRNQVKIYHWETKNFARHKATDDLVDKLDDNIDKFVEVYIGKYGRPSLNSRTGSIRIRNFNDQEAPVLLQQAINWMTTKLPSLLKPSDTDLLNIRDEILADLNQTLYLFTLTSGMNQLVSSGVPTGRLNDLSGIFMDSGVIGVWYWPSISAAPPFFPLRRRSVLRRVERFFICFVFFPISLFITKRRMCLFGFF